jgi:hypothetical protein
MAKERASEGVVTADQAGDQAVGRISSKEARDLVSPTSAPLAPEDAGAKIRSASNPQAETLIRGMGSPGFEKQAGTPAADAANLVEALEKSRAELTAKDRMRLERELRALVRRSGGARKGLTEDKLARLSRVCDLLGRSKDKPTWDKSIKLRGFQGK